MTKKEAIRLLIEHAAKNCVGAGCGFHTVPSHDVQVDVSRAILKVWPESYPIDRNVFRNLGLPIPPELGDKPKGD